MNFLKNTVALLLGIMLSHDVFPMNKNKRKFDTIEEEVKKIKKDEDRELEELMIQFQKISIRSKIENSISLTASNFIAKISIAADNQLPKEAQCKIMRLINKMGTKIANTLKEMGLKSLAKKAISDSKDITKIVKEIDDVTKKENLNFITELIFQCSMTFRDAIQTDEKIEQKVKNWFKTNPISDVPDVKKKRYYHDSSDEGKKLELEQEPLD